MFLVMKEHVIQSNSVSHWYIFNHFRTIWWISYTKCISIIKFWSFYGVLLSMRKIQNSSSLILFKTGGSLSVVNRWLDGYWKGLEQELYWIHRWNDNVGANHMYSSTQSYNSFKTQHVEAETLKQWLVLMEKCEVNSERCISCQSCMRVPSLPFWTNHSVVTGVGENVSLHTHAHSHILLISTAANPLTITWHCYVITSLQWKVGNISFLSLWVKTRKMGFDVEWRQHT